MNKTKIETWYYGSLDAPNGVAKFLSALKTGLNKSSNINYEVFCKDASKMVQDDFGLRKHKLRELISNYIKKNIKNLIFLLSKRSRYFSFLYIKLSSIRNINFVLNSNRQSEASTVLFFHDFISFYFYFERYPNADNKAIIVLHSNGDPLKMIYESFPLLEGYAPAEDFYQNVIQFSLKRANRIALLSESSRKIFISKHSEYRDKTEVVLNGIKDITNWDEGNNERLDKMTFISVGTVSKRKGFDMLVQAVRELEDNIKENIIIKIVGDGPILNNLKSYCDKHRLEMFKFLGTRKDIPKLLKQSDVFVLVSRDEGLPIAGIEALRQGKAVVLTDVGGMSEMVQDGVNGFLCQPDITSIRKAISSIYYRKNELKIFQRVSRKMYIQKFTAQMMLAKYEEILLRNEEV